MQCFRILLFTFTALVLCLTRPVIAGNNPISEAWESIKLNRPFNALMSLKSFYPDDRERAVYHYVYGRGLIGVKRYREAIGHLNESYVFADEKELKEASLYFRGVAYLRGGFSYEAALNFKIFINDFPRSAFIKDAYAHYARASLNINDFVNALKFYRLAGDTPDGLFGKAEVFHRLGLYSTASQIFSEAILKYKDYIRNHSETLYYYVENLRKTGNADDSKKLLYLLVETPFRDRAILSIGMIDIDTKDYDSAILQLKRCLHSTNRIVRRTAMLYLAKVYIKKDMKDEAIQLLQSLRQIFPYTNENREGLIVLTDLLTEQEDFIGSLSAVREVLFSSRPSQDAIESLKKLVLASMEKSPDDFAEIWRRCGIWLLDYRHQKVLIKVAKRLEKYGGDFLRIYRYLSQYGDTETKVNSMSRLAIFYADFGEHALASDYLRKVEKLGVVNDDILRLRARLYYGEGKKDAAYKTLKRIQHLDEDDMILFWRSSNPSTDVRDYLSIYKKIVRSTDLAPEYTEMADMLYSGKRVDDALKYYRIALTIDPDNDWALYRIGSHLPEGAELDRLSEKNNMFGQLAHTIKKEKDLGKMLKEVLNGV